MLLASVNGINGLHLARLGLLRSRGVVSGERTPEATRGSWLLCDNDPWQKSMPRLLFVSISSVKT